MPCFNAGAHVKDAVQSIRAVRFPMPVEILLVDDASTCPVTRQALDALENGQSEQVPLTITRLAGNNGQAHARNIALQQAQYDYIMPVDADDMLTYGAAGYASHAVKTLSQSPETMIAYARCRFIGAREGLFLLPPFDAKRIIVDNVIPVFAMYRRDNALAVGGYSEDLRYCEDWDLWLKLLHHAQQKGLSGTANQWSDGIPYLYRQHDHGHNVSEQQRLKHQDLLSRFAGEYPALYQNTVGSTDIADIMAYRKTLSSPIRELWLRASNTPSMGDFTRFVAQTIQARLHL